VAHLIFVKMLVVIPVFELWCVMMHFLNLTHLITFIIEFQQFL
jgi:hypothetical protein